MAEKKLVVEIAMTDAEEERLDAFIEFKCLDKEKYLKSLLRKELGAIVDTWERRLKTLSLSGNRVL